MGTLHKVFVLLSGGIDSTTTLAIARDEFPNAEFETVTMDYGQRHRREAICALTQAAEYGADHKIIDLKGLMAGMLVDKGDENEQIPEVSYADLPKGISPTYVSFRNGLMLSVLAARAQAWVMEQEKLGNEAHATIYAGVHADDGANDAYPDCTLEFAGAMANAIYVGTYFKVRVRVPLVHMTKPDVVAKGAQLGVNYAETWSCYAGEEKHCGTCPTCRARKEAFELSGYADPTEYQQ